MTRLQLLSSALTITCLAALSVTAAATAPSGAYFSDSADGTFRLSTAEDFGLDPEPDPDPPATVAWDEHGDEHTDHGCAEDEIVAWHFVLVRAPADAESFELTATFATDGDDDDLEVSVPGERRGQSPESAVHFDVIETDGAASLESAMAFLEGVEDPGDAQLNLSSTECQDETGNGDTSAETEPPPNEDSSPPSEAGSDDLADADEVTDDLEEDDPSAAAD